MNEWALLIWKESYLSWNHDSSKILFFEPWQPWILTASTLLRLKCKIGQPLLWCSLYIAQPISLKNSIPVVFTFFFGYNFQIIFLKAFFGSALSRNCVTCPHRVDTPSKLPLIHTCRCIGQSGVWWPCDHAISFQLIRKSVTVRTLELIYLYTN